MQRHHYQAKWKRRYFPAWSLNIKLLSVLKPSYVKKKASIKLAFLLNEFVHSLLLNVFTTSPWDNALVCSFLDFPID